MRGACRAIPWIVLFGLAAPAVAGAEPTADAEAQRLFLEGRAAIERGDYREGCPKFAESLKLVMRASTLLNFAQCEERAGRLRSALDHWNRGAALLDPDDERLKVARERKASLEARLPMLTVRIGAGTPPTAAISVDGVPLTSEELGTPLPMDPGDHLVKLTVPGQPEQELPLELAERDRKEVLLQVGAAPVAVTAPPAPAAAGGAPARRDAARTGGAAPVAEPRGLSGRQVAGLVVGGIGVAGAIAAGVTGGLIVARDAQIDDRCAAKRCTQEGIDLVEGNRTLLIVNAITVGVGAAGLGAGVLLLLTGGDEEAPRAGRPRRRDTPTTVAAAPLPDGAGILVRRSF